jgi:Protein of unknown function (DUF998)
MSDLRSPSTWALVAMVGVTCHAVLFGLLHWLEPQLSPKSSIISDYSATNSAWVTAATFVAFAATWFSLSLALSEASGASTVLAVGRALFLLAAVAILLGVLFPSAMDPRTPSTLARIQSVVSRPGLFLGLLLVPAGLRVVPGWSDLWPVLLTLAVICALVLVLTLTVLLERGLAGVGQRIIFGLIYAYVLVACFRLIKLEDQISIT